MASANVTLYDTGDEFEADGTQRTATINSPGANQYLYMTASGDAVVSFTGATINTTQATQAGCVRLKAGMPPLKIPNNCSSFVFKAAASTFIQFIKQ